MTNVVPISPTEDDTYDDAVSAYNNLYSRCLKAEARARGGSLSDKAMDAAGEAHGNLVWELIRTPGVVGYQIRYKLLVLKACSKMMGVGRIAATI